MKKVILFTILALFAAAPLFPAFVLAAPTPTLISASLDGSVVKLADSDTLYYISSDGKRFVFPNEQTYKTWFIDFSDVVVVTVEELASYSLSGNIRYRPGVVLLKIQTDPKVYAVTRDGGLRWVKTENIAKKLYGEYWNTLIDDISASFFTNYSIGEDIDDEDDLDVDAEVEENDTIEKDRGLSLGHLKQGKKASTTKCRAIPAVPGRGRDGEKTVRAISARECVHARNEERKEDRDDDEDGDDEDEDEDETDTTLPVISDILVTASTTSAIISWTTDEASDSKVEYADESLSTASSTELIDSDAFVANHSLELTGLVASTTYYFIIESEDESGNKATTTENMFTTVE